MIVTMVIMVMMVIMLIVDSGDDDIYIDDVVCEGAGFGGIGRIMQVGGRGLA